MRPILVGFPDHVIAVTCPDSLRGDAENLLKPLRAGKRRPDYSIDIKTHGRNRYRFCIDGVESEGLCTRATALVRLVDEVCRLAVFDVDDGLVLHAGAIAKGDRGILIAGPSGSGKSSLAAWFADRGFDYLTDEIVRVAPDGRSLAALPRPLIVKPGSKRHVQRLERLHSWREHKLGQKLALSPNVRTRRTCAINALILFPRFEKNAELALTPLTPAQAGLRLMECNLNSMNLEDGGLAAIQSVVGPAPALELRYGDYEQLEGRLDLLADLALTHEPSAVRDLLLSFCGGGAAAPVAATDPARLYPIPAPSPRGEKKKLTIGMATYDDYDGVFFTVQSLRMYHPEILDQVEFLVVDNHPDGKCSEALKHHESKIANYRYVPKFSRSGTSIRDVVFEEASSDCVLCLDCHVLIVPGAVQRLIDYFDRHRETCDLLQGPLIYEDLKTLAPDFEPIWERGLYGHFRSDDRARDPDGDPFEIQMQGLGLFACRRAAWPGFNRAFRKFGAEEGYVHEKFRQRGARVCACPSCAGCTASSGRWGFPIRSTGKAGFATI
jgi:hypothetical protein